MSRLNSILNATLISSGLLVGSAAFAASHIDNSSSDELIAKSDVCGAILQEAVDLAESAEGGLELTAEESNARASVRKRLSDCSATYLDSVDTVLTKFIENKP